MVIEYFNAGAAVDIYHRARDRGRQLPAGLEYVDSWVDLDYFRCFQLMRTSDRALFDTWIAAWSDLGHFESQYVLQPKLPSTLQISSNGMCQDIM